VAHPPAWTKLTDSNPNQILLCSDFTATGRSVATFADLAAATGLAASFFETAPPRPGAEAGLGSDGYVQRWAGELPVAGAEVVAVTGFCVGAVFAAPIYHAVCAQQATEPLLLLFDPERPSPQLLLRHFRELLLGMRQYLNAAELAAVDGHCQQAPVSSASMTELASWLADRFTTIATAALQRIGLDAEYSGEVAATFRSFISYLAAASGIDPTAAWQQATAFSSADPHSGLNSLAPADRAAAVAIEHRFDLHHTTLLSDPAVAERVCGLLRAALPASAGR
jgi:hypothetical protein